MTKANLTISIIQSEIKWHDVDANLAAIEQQLATVRESDMIVLPEMFATGFIVDETPITAETERILAWMRQTAARFNAAVVGSVAVCEAGKWFNRMYFITPDGAQTYDKRHLFPKSPEPTHFERGTELPIFEFRGWRICPQICYNLRFPVWSRNAMSDGAYKYDILLYVANWPAGRAESWNTLVKARAIENQAFVVACNCVGDDPQGNHYQGDSQLIGMTGREEARAAGETAQVVQSTISMQKLQTCRRNFPVAEDWD